MADFKDVGRDDKGLSKGMVKGLDKGSMLHSEQSW